MPKTNEYLENEYRLKCLIIDLFNQTLSWKFCFEQHAISHRIYIAIIFYIFMVHPEVD